MPGPKNTSAASINRLANELPCARQLFKALNEDDGKLKAQECLRAGQRHAAFQQHFLNGSECATTQLRGPHQPSCILCREEHQFGIAESMVATIESTTKGRTSCFPFWYFCSTKALDAIAPD